MAKVITIDFNGSNKSPGKQGKVPEFMSDRLASVQEFHTSITPRLEEETVNTMSRLAILLGTDVPPQK